LKITLLHGVSVITNFVIPKCDIKKKQKKKHHTFSSTASGPLSRANFHVYRGNVSPLRGEKPILGAVSKNNTCMAALRAGLPVIYKLLLHNTVQ